MKVCLSYSFFILALCCVACKKKPNGPASSRMNGNFMWTGTSSRARERTDTMVFAQLNVTVLSPTTIVIRKDTLQYRSTDSNNIVIFYHDRNTSLSTFSIDESWFYYDPSKNIMSYRSSVSVAFGGEGEDITTARYAPNRSLRGYMDHIVGTRTMSGQVYDSSVFYSHVDTLYSINPTIEFSAINDSTILFSNDILALGDNILHYRYTDEAAGTVTFQTFNDRLNKYSALVYNYQTRQLIFRQYRNKIPDFRSYLQVQ